MNEYHNALAFKKVHPLPPISHIGTWSGKLEARAQKSLPSSSDEDSVETCGLKAEASNLGADGFCFLAGFQ